MLLVHDTTINSTQDNSFWATLTQASSRFPWSQNNNNNNNSMSDRNCTLVVVSGEESSTTARQQLSTLKNEIPFMIQHMASVLARFVLVQVPSRKPRMCHFLYASEVTFQLRRRVLHRRSATFLLIMANGLVHAAWRLAMMQQKPHNKRSEFMRRHFILPGRRSERQSRPHTYLTSAFSHISMDHLLNNMLALYMFGPPVEKALTARQYIYGYIAAAYGSVLLDVHLFHDLDSKLLVDFLLKHFSEHLPNELLEFVKVSVKEQQKKRSSWLQNLISPMVPKGSLGASGAISALMAYSCLKFPNQTIDVGYIEEVPARSALLVFALMDAMGMGQRGSAVGHGAHLGGYTFGALAYLGKDVCWEFAKQIWKRHGPKVKYWWRETWPKMKTKMSRHRFGMTCFLGFFTVGSLVSCVFVLGGSDMVNERVFKSDA